MGTQVPRMKNRIHRIFSLCLFSLLLFASPGAAEIEVRGDDAFKQAVQACFEMFLEAGDEFATRLRELQDSPRKHIIQPTAARANSALPADGRAAKSNGAGGTGAGSGTTVSWSPTNTSAYADGTPRDPCASLFHELYHASDMDKGTFDPRVDPDSRIKRSEVDASRAENKYRKAVGLPQRTQYGQKPLPADAIFN